MNERFKIGMFGFFEFDIRKKTKYGDQVTPMSGYWKITDADDKNVEISDGQKTLIVTKRRIKKFIPAKEPCL